MVLTRSPEIARPVTPEGSDAFTDLNDENYITEQRDDKLNSLRRRLTSAGFCSASEIIQAENALPVCWEYTEDNWEAEFMNELDAFTDLNDENDITEQRDDKLNSLRR